MSASARPRISTRLVAVEDLLARSYAAALEHGYRWHEFGDSQLIL